MKAKVLLLLAIAVGAVYLGGSTAAATMPTGGFLATPLVKGTLATPNEIESLGIHYANEGPADVYTQVVDFPPKSGSGWHQHPGLTIVSVKTGSLLVHHGCRLVTYAAGQSFVEPPFESILVENTANTAAQSYATLVVPAGRMARIDVLVAPNCTGEGAED